MNRVSVEKYSEEKIARLRYSRQSATTTTARLAGAMLRYMCDARERKLLQFDQNRTDTPPSRANLREANQKTTAAGEDH